MSRRILQVFGWGVLGGAVLIGGIALWWGQGPSETRIRRTVVTTVQEEAPASFLVTGTLDLSVTVRVDSSQYATPDWLTYVLNQAQPTLLPLLRGSSQTQVRVPGTVAYGFDVRSLRPEMISVEDDGVVAVDLPELSVYSVETDLQHLRVRTSSQGWMRLFPSDVRREVRSEALGEVRKAFRTQAERHLASAAQPRVNTARALENMLTPPLRAAGLDDPRFRIRIGDRLSLEPRENTDETFRND